MNRRGFFSALATFFLARYFPKRPAPVVNVLRFKKIASGPNGETWAFERSQPRWNFKWHGYVD